MSQEYLSVAIWEPLPGMDAAARATMLELHDIVSAKGYGRDLLYRAGSQYMLLRYWSSEESRRAALEDPELLRCWARLGNEIQTLKVYEKLEEVAA
ncbi:MAG: hypothetical protein WBX38_03530 [Candidatus Sulfotelmatobacter sp.]